jgi:hypothetical protein
MNRLSDDLIIDIMKHLDDNVLEYYVFASKRMHDIYVDFCYQKLKSKKFYKFQMTDVPKCLYMYVFELESVDTFNKNAYDICSGNVQQIQNKIHDYIHNKTFNDKFGQNNCVKLICSKVIKNREECDITHYCTFNENIITKYTSHQKEPSIIFETTKYYQPCDILEIVNKISKNDYNINSQYTIIQDNVKTFYMTLSCVF